MSDNLIVCTVIGGVKGTNPEPLPQGFKDFIDEIQSGSNRNQGNFDDGAWVQETINAVELSFHERRWVDLPLDGY